MNLSQCEQALQTQYDANPNSMDNISQLTNLARSKDKLSCMNQMGGISHIKDFFTNRDAYLAFQKTNPVQTTTVQTTTTTTDSRRTSSRHAIGSQSNYFFRGIGIIVWAIILFAIIKKALIFFYDIVNAHRIVYLKVMLPRNDSKEDRDQDKEIAKDMKEKIWRMSQVFHNIHKLWELSTWDAFMKRIFYKPKTTFMLHYEDGILYFIVWIYPEYQSIVESSISAQYSDCSIERIPSPEIFRKKFRNIMPLVPKKLQVYTMKTFKQQPDDPMNNVIDAIGKISRYDTATIVLSIKPLGEWFNRKTQKRAEWLYRNDKKYTDEENVFLTILKFLNPFHIIKFLISWKTKDWGNEANNEKYKEWGKDFVRMVKAKEDYLNSMWEEASLPFSQTGILIATSSDNRANLDANTDIIVSAFNVYGDEYGNELIPTNEKHDLFGFFYKPMRKFAIKHKLDHFFFKKSMFGVNELSSIFHFPDNSYNRSPIISWMQYKVLPAPDNLPVLSTPNGLVMGWVLAESYHKGQLEDILSEYTWHWAVGEKPGLATVKWKKEYG